LAQENFLTFLGACACFLDGFVDAPGEKKIPRPLGVSSADQKICGGLNPLFCARRVVWRVVRGLVFFWVVVLGLGLGWVGPLVLDSGLGLGAGSWLCSGWSWGSPFRRCFGARFRAALGAGFLARFGRPVRRLAGLGFGPRGSLCGAFPLRSTGQTGVCFLALSACYAAF
jgi:hypothetical protein